MVDIAMQLTVFTTQQGLILDSRMAACLAYWQHICRCDWEKRTSRARKADIMLIGD